MAARRSKSSKSQDKANREFVSEAEEILDTMSGDLSELHEQRAGGDVDPDLVNRVFRSAHSLKGLAGMFGLVGIGELAHHMEDILDALRLGRMRFDSPAVSILDEAVALFVSQLGKLGDGDPQEELELAVAELVARIEGAVEEPSPEPDDLSELSIDPTLLRALTEYEEHRLRDNIRRGRELVLVDATFEILSFEEGLAEISAAVKEVGEVVSTLPSPGEAPDSQIRFSLLVATDIDHIELRDRLELPESQSGRSSVGPQRRRRPSSRAPRLRPSRPLRRASRTRRVRARPLRSSRSARLPRRCGSTFASSTNS
jgi:two-component system chemotaxis sensor kinase CheA